MYLYRHRCTDIKKYNLPQSFHVLRNVHCNYITLQVMCQRCLMSKCISNRYPISAVCVNCAALDQTLPPSSLVSFDYKKSIIF